MSQTQETAVRLTDQGDCEMCGEPITPDHPGEVVGYRTLLHRYCAATLITAPAESIAQVQLRPTASCCVLSAVG
jgi:hypothetical protein